VSADQRYGAKPEIKVDGSELSAELELLIEKVMVDTDLHQPDMFTLTFRDNERNVLERSGIDIGKEIDIATTPIGDGSQTRLMIGDVVGVEVHFGRQGTMTVVRGFDRSHRFRRGRHTRTFSNVSDTDIARQIADEVSVKVGNIDIREVVYDHVSQINMTDWDFLTGRAQEAGYEIAVVDGELEMVRPTPSDRGPDGGDIQTEDPLQLTLGATLDRFMGRVTAAGQVSEVEVRGWDIKQKEPIVSSRQAETKSAAVDKSPTDLAGTFGGSPKYVVFDRPIETQAEADIAAEGIAEQIASAHAEADGVAPGNPALRPGVPVSVNLVGKPYDGKYVLTSATHLYSDAGYKTSFRVSGRQDRSLLGLATMGGSRGAQSAGGTKIYGVVPATVADVQDPEGLGRVRLKFPWLADDYESWWARLTQFGAGADTRGSLFLPEVDDEVLVAFEHGDIRRPYVIGSLYNGQDTPNVDGVVDGSSGEINRREIRSRTGHRLEFYEEPGKSAIEIHEANDGLEILMSGTDRKITITSDGEVEITGSTSMTIKADMDVTIEAGTSLELKGGTGVKIDGGPQVEVTGGMVKLN